MIMGIVVTLVAAIIPGGPGVSGISVTESQVVAHVQAPDRPVALVELRPYQQYAAEAGYPVVWDGDVEGGAIRVPRFDGPRDRMFSKFLMVDGQTREPIGEAHYVTDLSALDVWDFDFPWPESIKGLQVQMVDDAVALGVKHAGLNVGLPQVIDWSGKSDVFHEADGERIAINMGYISGLDKTVKGLTDAGMNVTAILNNQIPTAPNPDNPLIHPNTDLANAPFHLGAINVTDDRGLLYYRAVMEFFASRYARPDAEHGWISGYIVGNEVQAHWEWYNIGKMPLDAFIEDYGIALRYCDLAIRKYHAKARTYVSMEHHWNEAIRDDPLTAFKGKAFLEGLSAWANAGGDFPWQVAFHPYPENLFDPRFWNDRHAVLSFDTPRITFKNCEVLPAFLNQSQFLHQGNPRRIIFSEQGFNTPDGPDGEVAQAAAYACAYHKISHMPEIDAFILHRHVDHKKEGGLKLGLWTWKEEGGSCDPGRKKPIYDVFRLADTDEWEDAFAFAKPIVGINTWDEVLPSERIEATPGVSPELTLVSEGKSRYVIVVPDEAEAPIPYAAAELQSILNEMAGVELAIVRESEAGVGPAILIGPSERARKAVDQAALDGLREDGVLIRTHDGDVVLLGQNARGQLYSVYVLLERYLGVRFLARDCTVVPERAEVTLPAIDHAYSPPFMYRETLYFDSFPKETAVRQRLNGPTTKCDEEVGGKIAFHPYVHSFNKMLPPEVYSEEHPEYFSLVGGERKATEIHGQLCLTNPDVLRIATAQVLKWIEENPDVPIIDVSQNDGNGACECDACMKVVAEEGCQHGPILRFVNAIADVVAEKHPDKWVETLAYAYSTKPPAITKPRDNVIIRLCHAGCFFHGLKACGLGASFSQYIDEWSKLTRRIFIWHYATNFAHYLAPNQNLDALAKDLRYYADHGVNGVMVQGNYQCPGGELAELRQYIASQLMWDPDRDPGMLRLEFCRGYYGAAADEVLAYLALLDEAAKDPDRHAFAAWDPKDTVTPEMVADGLAMLARARAKAAAPEAAKRVARLLLPLWYMQLSYPERYGLPLAEGGQVLREFRTVVEANAVTHIREGEENMSEWLVQMEAKYGDVPDSVVYDLFLQMGKATVANSMDWRLDSVEIDGQTRVSIFHHPPAEGHGDATFEIPLPSLAQGEKLVLRFATAFTGATENGARFAVLVNGGEAWAATQTDVEPVTREVDLTANAGSTIQLTLRVDALGNTGYDWANWVRPQIFREP
jgi:Family of unknown function (DUF5722)/Domain of unknown function (DUF4838)/Glycosyl hydrolase family 67 N-terminus